MILLKVNACQKKKKIKKLLKRARQALGCSLEPLLFSTIFLWPPWLKCRKPYSHSNLMIHYICVYAVDFHLCIWTNKMSELLLGVVALSQYLKCVNHPITITLNTCKPKLKQLKDVYKSTYIIMVSVVWQSIMSTMSRSRQKYLYWSMIFIDAGRYCLEVCGSPSLRCPRLCWRTQQQPPSSISSSTSTLAASALPAWRSACDQTLILLALVLAGLFSHVQWSWYGISPNLAGSVIM